MASLDVRMVRRYICKGGREGRKREGGERERGRKGGGREGGRDGGTEGGREGGREGKIEEEYTVISLFSSWKYFRTVFVD